MKTYSIYKSEITGFEDVEETVRVSEKVAASKIHLLKEQVNLLGFYSKELENVLGRLYKFYRGNHPYLQTHPGKKVLVAVFGDKGLVGSLWHNMVDLTLKSLGMYDCIVVIGAKGIEYLSSENIKIDKTFSAFSDAPTPLELKTLTDYLFTQYSLKSFSRIDILYPSFITLAEQKPVIYKLLPFTFVAENLDFAADEGLPIFASSRKEMFSLLLEKFISVFFYKIILESKLSELGARTISTEHAQKKVQELINSTRKEFLKERRKVITLKQLESFLSHKVI